jgi:putative transposase
MVLQFLQIQKGSNKRIKTRLKVAKVHKKITNSRKDAIHKATTNLVRNNDIIIMENLKTKNMIRNRKLAKAISDASFVEIKKTIRIQMQMVSKDFSKNWYFLPKFKNLFSLWLDKTRLNSKRPLLVMFAMC